MLGKYAYNIVYGLASMHVFVRCDVLLPIDMLDLGSYA